MRFVRAQLLVGVMVAQVSVKEALLALVKVYYLNILTLTGKLGGVFLIPVSTVLYEKINKNPG